MKKKITSNVLDSISKRLGGEGQSIDGKKALVVFNGTNVGIDKRIDMIKEIKNQGVQISLAFSFMAENILNTKKIINSLSPVNIYKEEDIFRLKDLANEYSFIIGPNISINTLSKISLGMIDSFIPTLIWTFIYQGKKVYLDFISIRNYLGEETSNKEVKDLIEKHINEIKKMGAIEIDDNSYIKNIKIPGTTTKTVVKNNSNNINNKEVITEKDILELAKNNSLILPKGAIITPLARDKARELNINIQIK